MKKAAVVFGFTLWTMAAFYIVLSSEASAAGVIYLGNSSAFTQYGAATFGATSTALRAVPSGTTLYETYCLTFFNNGHASSVISGLLTSAFGTTVYGGPSISWSGTKQKLCNTATSTTVATIVAGTPYFTEFFMSGASAGNTIDFTDTGDFYELTTDPSVVNFDLELATSSGLYANGSVASSTIPCATGNIFSDGFCSALVYLLVPDPNVTNGYLAIVSTTSPTSVLNHFPFSWFLDTGQILSSLQASTTQMVAWVIPLHDIGLGSTTPMGNFLPNITILSSTTITYYIGMDRWNALQLLLIASLYLGFAYGLYREAKFLAAKHH